MKVIPLVIFYLLLKFTESFLSCPSSKLKDVQDILSDYGKTWVSFPNDNGTLVKAEIKDPVNASLLYLPIEEYVSFQLYTRKNYNTSTILQVNDTEAFNKSHFDAKKMTKFFIHGWLSNGKAESCQMIKDNYLNVDDCNVFCVDWSAIANDINYLVSVYETINVGALVAEFLNFLVEQGSNISTFHLVGHSLGAHICGIAASDVKSGKIPRISGLDPALPGFALLGLEKYTLSANDAEFVDIIHTCAGVLGIPKSIGDVDFFPNGGLPCQPGCKGFFEDIVGCSHSRAWQYYARSILNRSLYVATKCDSWESYLRKICKDNQKDLMGAYANETIWGNFYLNATF